MYQFVFGFISITDLSIDVEWQVCTTLLVSQLSLFASDLILVYVDNWPTFNFEVSKYDYYT